MSWFDRLRSSQVFRNLGWILSANILISVTNFVGSVLVVRYLGIDQYGHVVLALAVSTMLTPLVIQNSERLVMFSIADAKHSSGAVVGSMGGAMAMAALPCFLVVAALPYFGLAEEPELFFLVGLSLLPLPARVIRPLMLYESRSNVNFWSDCIFAFVGLAVRVALVVGGAGLAWFGGALLMQNIAAAVVLLLLFLQTRNPGDGLVFDLSIAAETLKRSWPVVLTSFATATTAQLDRVVLGEVGDSAAVGMLGLLVQLILPIRIIASSAAAARLPKLIAGGINDAEYFQAEARRGLSLSVSVAILMGAIVLAALPVFSILFAADLTAHRDIFAILVAGYVLSIPSQYRLEYAMSIGAERHYLITTTAAAAIGAAVVVVLVSSFGLLGAAFSAPVLNLLTNVIALYGGNTMAAYRPVYWQSLIKGFSIRPLVAFVRNGMARR